MKTFSALILIAFLLQACSSSRSSRDGVQALPIEQISSNESGQGPIIQLTFQKGPSHNHPLMAVWVEDMEGNFIQSLFVASSIATGVFSYGTHREGKWAPGERRRPAALPYWAHKRGIRAADGFYTPDANTPVADAYSGATPKTSFVLTSRLDDPRNKAFRILLEINQSWDWNAFWTNTKYPEDEHYKTSSQPAVVYAAVLDPTRVGEEVRLEPIGRSHHAGQDGNLYDDLHTLTTALSITAGLSAKLLP